MFILMLQFSAMPAPDMHEMATALRGWGHRVLVATPDHEDDLCFDEAGHEVVHIFGQKRILVRIARLVPVASIARTLAQFVFMLRIRALLATQCPDVVQANPTGCSFLLSIFPAYKFVYLINAPLFCRHACFTSEAAATLLGKNRRVVFKQLSQNTVCVRALLKRCFS